MTNRHAKWPLAGVLSGLVILACGTTPAEAHPGRRVAPIERRALQEQLGLTEDQVQAIREIRRRHRDSMRETVRALREARRLLRDMALGEQDEATFDAKAAEVRELAGSGAGGAGPHAPGSGPPPDARAADEAPRAAAAPAPPPGAARRLKRGESGQPGGAGGALPGDPARCLRRRGSPCTGRSGCRRSSGRPGTTGVAVKRRARIPAAAARTADRAASASSSVGTWRPTTPDSRNLSSTRAGRRPNSSRHTSA